MMTNSAPSAEGRSGPLAGVRHRARPTKDGLAMIIPYSPQNYRDLFCAAGRPDLAQDPRVNVEFLDARRAGEAISELVESVTPSLTTEEWIEVCTKHSIPVGPVLRLDEAADDPYVREGHLLDGEAVPAALELAAEVAANAPLALAAVKTVVRLADAVSDTEAFTLQRNETRSLRESADFAEGVRAFTGKRTPKTRCQMIQDLLLTAPLPEGGGFFVLRLQA
ncbi:CoA transferase [Saccharopolyspora shandongensis]|uniref:CoA transferase n=1 Tax=Saccharopolyspora shandongensis TaxID=418495 RepID=UPI003F4D6A14